MEDSLKKITQEAKSIKIPSKRQIMQMAIAGKNDPALHEKFNAEFESRNKKLLSLLNRIEARHSIKFPGYAST